MRRSQVQLGGGGRLHLVNQEVACVDSAGVGWGRIAGMHWCRESALSETLSSWKCLKAWQYTLQASLWGLSYSEILLGVVKNSIACTKGIFPVGQNYKCIYPCTKVSPLAEIDHRFFNRVIQLEKREKMQKNRETFFKKWIFNWRIIALQCFLGFCHMTRWISCKYTHIPSRLSLPPASSLSHSSRLSQGTTLNSLCHTAHPTS